MVYFFSLVFNHMNSTYCYINVLNILKIIHFERRHPVYSVVGGKHCGIFHHCLLLTPSITLVSLGFIDDFDYVYRTMFIILYCYF